jgi:hypothetical protein
VGHTRVLQCRGIGGGRAGFGVGPLVTRQELILFLGVVGAFVLGFFFRGMMQGC